MDKLRAIKYFCRAVETSNFTSAARLLGVPQSVLSKTIAALEADLQFTLFNRSTRRIALTEAGAAYYDACRQIILDMEAAEAHARDGSVQATGTLRIGLHPVFQISLCNKIGEFLSVNPGVSAELTHTNSPTALLEEGLDVVLRVGPVKDSSFVARELGWVELLVCASPGYLRQHGRPEHPRDLARHHAIIPGRHDEDSFIRWTFLNGEDREVIKVPVRLVLHEGVGLGVSAAGGVGIVRMYDVAVRPFIENGSLEPILPEWTSGREPVYAVIPSRRNVPAKVRAFIEFARSLLVE
jgi:LysR family transcriptional regulator for bpeEF and oprC